MVFWWPEKRFLQIFDPERLGARAKKWEKLLSRDRDKERVTAEDDAAKRIKKPFEYRRNFNKCMYFNMNTNAYWYENELNIIDMWISYYLYCDKMVYCEGDDYLKKWAHKRRTSQLKHDPSIVCNSNADFFFGWRVGKKEGELCTPKIQKNAI